MHAFRCRRFSARTRAAASHIENLESRRLLSAILRVDVNSTAPTPDGASWNTAFADLQQALSIANNGDQIWIADGTYYPTAGTDRTISFELKEGVSLYGGYAGIGAPNPDLRDFNQFVTNLSGNIGDKNSVMDNSSRVVRGREEALITSATIVDGLTIRDGHWDANAASNGGGGGMLLHNATPRVSNCTFFNNGFAGVGGGLVMNDDVPVFDNPPLETLSITDCKFIGNYYLPTNQWFVQGGGLCLKAKAIIERCEFRENSAGWGGGMYARGSVTLRDSIFIRNQADTGGALYLEDASATVLNSRFHGNIAGVGGAVRTKGGTNQFANCDFVGNRAQGVAFQQGGGLYITGATTLANCNLVANSSVNSGGGAYRGSSSAAFAILNSTVRENIGSAASQLNAGTVASSNIEGGFAGTNIIDADARFVRNPSPGADNSWGTSDDDYGDLRLQITSPNIDAGNNASVPAGVTTDIDGRARFFDFPGVNDGAGAAVDIGAHELDLRLGLLRAPANQSLALPAGKHTFFVEQLDLQPNATLDVRDNSLILDYTGTSSLASVTSAIRAARAGGAWNGVGITSTTARDNPLRNTTLGAMEATEFKSIYSPTATFGGHAFDSSAVLVKYTYYGDADFNGQVNFDDYSRIDNGFSTNKTGWLNGDFDLSGSVNFDDYALIDLAFNTQGSPLRVGVAGGGARRERVGAMR